MPILAIGGSGRNAGKTTLICALIRELSEFRWTAVKVTAHGHSPETVWEETTAGQGTDTARYLAAGACRALLVCASESEFPMSTVSAALASDANVIFESNRIVDYLQPDIALAIVGRGNDVKPSFRAFLSRADAIVLLPGQDMTHSGLPEVPVFPLGDFQSVSQEMILWLRERLKTQNG